METSDRFHTRAVADGVHLLCAHLPVPGLGVLPVNAFLVAGDEPLLVDTGVAAFRESFISALRNLIDPADLRWIWLTHTDPDHVGNLAAVLAEAPNARVVTTFLGMAKMSLLGLAVERVHLLNPGQSLEAGSQRFAAVAPPVFDAPETTALLDTRRRILFSADTFGAPTAVPAEDAAEIASGELREGQMLWARVDAPWLQNVASHSLDAGLERIRALQPELVLSSHLPPAAGMLDTMLENLRSACGAPPFLGPDQAAFEAMIREGVQAG